MIVRPNNMNLLFGLGQTNNIYLIKFHKIYIPVCAIFMGTPLDVFISWNVLLCFFKATESNLSLVTHIHVYINSHTFSGSFTNWRKSTCICICQQGVQEVGHLCPWGHFTCSGWYADRLPWHQNELQCRCSTQKHRRSSCHSCRPWKVSWLHSGTHPRRYG